MHAIIVVQVLKYDEPYISLVFLVITVIFIQSVYTVNEGAGSALLMLVISSPSPTDITVQVTNTDGSATG